MLLNSCVFPQMFLFGMGTAETRVEGRKTLVYNVACDTVYEEQMRMLAVLHSESDDLTCLAQVFIVSSSMDCSNRTVLCEAILHFKNKNYLIETARKAIDQSLKVLVQSGPLSWTTTA